MKHLFVLLITIAGTALVHAEATPRHTWDLVYPAFAHPEQYAGKTTGHFGRKFVGVAKRKFHPTPDTPKRIRGTTEAGVVQADLLIGKDGRVKDVAIVAKTPEDIVDESVLKFFRSVIFAEERDGKRSIEYETELVVVFRPFHEKKG